MFIIVDLGALIIFLAILGIGLGYTTVSYTHLTLPTNSLV